MSMPRMRLQGFDYGRAGFTCALTICARAGTRPFRDPRIAEMVLESLEWLRRERSLSIYAFCLMPNHLHLLGGFTDDGPALGTVIQSFKRFTSLGSQKLGRSGSLWQARFHDHVLREGDDAIRMAEYIVNNPVRAGLVERPEDYPYTGMPDPL